MNDYQKCRFVNACFCMFNTIVEEDLHAQLRVQEGHGDTRDSPAIDVGHGLIEDGAELNIYDPRVAAAQISMNMGEKAMSSIACCKTHTESVTGAHAVCIMTEWEEFKTYDWEAIYSVMQKPAFVFDGRLILDHQKLRDIGFIVYAIGKPLDPFLRSTKGAT